jgi:hypothetical protein
MTQKDSRFWLVAAALFLAACGQGDDSSHAGREFGGVWMKEYGECGDAARIDVKGKAATVSVRGADKTWTPVDGAFELVSDRELAGPDLTLAVDGTRMEWLQGGAPICAFVRE